METSKFTNEEIKEIEAVVNSIVEKHAKEKVTILKPDKLFEVKFTCNGKEIQNSGFSVTIEKDGKNETLIVPFRAGGIKENILGILEGIYNQTGGDEKNPLHNVIQENDKPNCREIEEYLKNNNL